MKDRIGRSFSGFQRSFAAFTAGQKVVAIVGTLALLLAGFMVFKWAATPSYSPLFSNLSSADASAVIEELDAQGVPYEISGGGTTIMVPQDLVYSTRITLSGDGLPTNSGEGGYSLLDGQSLSTSQFQEQTSFKRAMEGELAKTIEAINGVQTAVVHLALPEKQVFADEQDPATASVLVSLKPGTTFAPEQVQAVVHLVASSIDGLDPAEVTVADSTGRVLSTDDGSGSAGGRTQAVSDYQDELTRKIQATLDRVVGAGNSTVAVTADLDFDKSVTESTTYEDSGAPALSESTQTETYNGAGAGNQADGGVVGPDGQMDTATDGGTDAADSSYEKSTSTADNSVNTTVERRESAPGAVKTVHISAILDSNAPVKVDPATVRDLITAAVGADRQAGDTVLVSSLPFDTSAADAAQEELAAAEKADAAAAQMSLYRNIGLGVLIALMLLLAWLKGRKRAKQRAAATTYVVEQLRAEQAARAAAVAAPATAVMALEAAEADEQNKLRGELTELVERQPEDVAALLRGWLVERN